MAEKLKRVRGMQDILPAQCERRRHAEATALRIAECFGYGELRIPTLEKTELFQRSVGETTDVVQKEMYTLEMGRESLTLRPEGTAGAVRAVLENGMLNDALPLKICYLVSCFRHEKPQAGRFREHEQFGIEVFGSDKPSQDAEVICLASDLLAELGIRNVELQINSIGCPCCRPAYHKKLVEYYESHRESLCETCVERLGRNPLRLIDCKDERCKPLKLGAPRSIEHICPDCDEHFAGLKKSLDAFGISYAVNADIVRGLDYYTRTVFEFVYTGIGAQGTVCGGGRYDGLIAQMGGPPTPGLGFGMGIDRILMVMEKESSDFPEPKRCDIYIGSMGGAENLLAQELTAALRREGFYALFDTMGRSVKAQMKYADKMNAVHSCVIGSNEMENAGVNVKNMETGESFPVALTAEAFIEFLYARMADRVAGE
ncbi:MAG: histidine--tRNA ligase [Oscillospiraceae bacterium]|nr:histidine--tRNA ligase [Oscillospiraceae bacterium]